MLFIIVPAVVFIVVFLYCWIFEDEFGPGLGLGSIFACRIALHSNSQLILHR